LIWAAVLLALVTVLLLPFDSFAANVLPLAEQDSQKSLQEFKDFKLTMARYHEANAEWGHACECYRTLLSLDRDQPDLKKRFVFCLRQCHRKFRLGDPSFVPTVLQTELRLSDSLDFYKDVAGKIQQAYIHNEKANFTKLFQEGVEELSLDLEDPDFRKFLRPTLTDGEVQEFRARLRQQWGAAKVADLKETVKNVRTIALEALRKLDLNPKLVIVEFACGACNALDEYSFYLTQRGLSSLTEERIGVEAQVIEKGIGHIRILSFDDSTIQNLEAILQQFKMNMVEVIVLDLRGSPGGNLEVAVQVVERFVPAPQPIASTSGKDNKNYNSTTMQVVSGPLFVLVDNETASAAELVAGSLKAHKRAELVGQNTYGKNLVQRMVPVSMAPFGAIHLTSSKFHLPKPDELSKAGGIAPTIAADAGKELEVVLPRARALVSMR
jgi:hypothetical protein